MGFLSNINFGNTQTSSYGSDTSAFDFQGAISAGSQSGSFNTGQAANALLDGAASAIPFGSFAKDILDSMGLSRNIDLVSEYGLNSWGASNSPEMIEESFTAKVFPHVQNLLAQIEGGDIQGVANRMELLCEANLVYHKNLMQNHSKADSTKAAHKWAIDAWTKLRDKFRKNMNQLISNGFKITSSVKTLPVTDEQALIAYDKDSLSEANLGVGTVQVKQYQVVNPEKVEIDDEGNIKPKKSRFGLVALGSGIIYAIKSGAIKI